ncbi:hypothetical protein ABZU76_38335 [Amycolatopsis sp. NPDC005232]|uniref:hypothetical protein n=1 Tax=Amycolatopsis sp. NPDC005232 TaxID=3157027 RepID=UPI00339F51F0
MRDGRDEVDGQGRDRQAPDALAQPGMVLEGASHGRETRFRAVVTDQVDALHSVQTDGELDHPAGDVKGARHVDRRLLPSVHVERGTRVLAAGVDLNGVVEQITRGPGSLMV